jgi:hypothetical protein
VGQSGADKNRRHLFCSILETIIFVEGKVLTVFGHVPHAAIFGQHGQHRTKRTTNEGGFFNNFKNIKLVYLVGSPVAPSNPIMPRRSLDTLKPFCK